MVSPRRRGPLESVILTLSLLVELSKILVPFASTLVLSLLSYVTLAAPTVNLFLPLFIFPACFYWLVHRKSLIPFWSLFLLGLLVDALSATPLGLTAFVLLLMHYVMDLREQQITNAGIIELWLLFALVTVGGLGLSWVAIQVLHWQFLDPTALILRGFATVLSYPLVYILLAPVDRLFLGRPD